MLKGIPDIIDSNLLKCLSDMGHGDAIVISDHFYPAVSNTPTGNILYAKGTTVPQIIEAILQLITLDTVYEPFPVEIIKPDSGFESALEGRPKIWDEIIQVIKENTPDANIGYTSRGDFYVKARNSFATVSTSDTRAYGCVILKKGVN